MAYESVIWIKNPAHEYQNNLSEFTAEEGVLLRRHKPKTRGC